MTKVLETMAIRTEIATKWPLDLALRPAAPGEVDASLDGEWTRPQPPAHRMIHVGELSPSSGAADLLISIAIWAEQHPERPVEIWWAGDGDLAGVLAAQPLPGTVSQRFLGHLDPPGMIRAFRQCGLLVVPSHAEDRQAPVAEALAAGLLVLGSRRNARVRQVVRHAVNGWRFDPAQPGEMFEVVSCALAVPAEQLDLMRGRGRLSVSAPKSQRAIQRIGKRIAALVSGRLPKSAATPALASEV